MTRFFDVVSEAPPITAAGDESSPRGLATTPTSVGVNDVPDDSRICRLIDLNLFSGSSDLFRQTAGGHFIEVRDPYYGTKDTEFLNSVLTFPKSSFLHDIQSYSGDHIQIPVEQISEDTIIPNNQFICAAYGNPHLVTDDKMWKILWTGGIIDDKEYDPFLNEATYNDFYTLIQKPYPKIQDQYLVNPESVTNYIEISYDFNKYRANYQDYASNIDSELLLPNGYMMKQANMHATSSDDMLGWAYNWISVDDAIDEPWEIFNTFKSLPLEDDDSSLSREWYDSVGDYLDVTHILSALSSSTKKVVQEKMQNVIFNNNTYQDYGEYNEAIMENMPYYIKINFPVHIGSGTSFRDTIKRAEYDTRFLRLIKEVFLEQDPEKILPHNIQFNRQVKEMSSSIGAEANSEITTIENVEYRAVNLTSLLLYSYDKIKCEQEDFTIIDKKGIETASAYDMKGVYRHINTAATLNVMDPVTLQVGASFNINNISTILNVQDADHDDLVTLDGEDAYETHAPQTKYNEILAYRIEKKGVVPGSNIVDTMQNFWFFNSEDIGEKFEFFDTQVKYDKDYTYKVYAYTLIWGTKYRYSNLQLSRIIGKAGEKIVDDETGVETDPPTFCIEYYDPATDETVNDLLINLFDVYASAPGVGGLGSDWMMSSLATEAQRMAISRKEPGQPPYLANFLVTVEPSIRIVEVPLFEKTLKILDHPPNQLNILPSFTKDNTNHLSFQASYETFTKNTLNYPNAISALDKNVKSDYLNANDLIESTTLELPTVSRQAGIEVYRIDKRPESFEDFEGALLKTIDLTLEDFDASSDGVVFYDQVKSNKKYYYLFRSLNQLGMPGYFGEVMQAELINDGGYKYALFDTLFGQDLTHEDFLNPSTAAKKIFQLTPSLQQMSLNTDASDFQQDAASQYDGVLVGDAANLIWGKTFKVRLTSRKTNRKIDLNITYNKFTEAENPK